MLTCFFTKSNIRGLMPLSYLPNQYEAVANLLFYLSIKTGNSGKELILLCPKVTKYETLHFISLTHAHTERDLF